MTRLLPHSLQDRLTLAIFFSFILVGAFSAFLIITSSSRYHNEVTQLMHQDLAKHVAEHYTFDENGEINISKIKQVFHELMILGPNFEFYILDNSGNILAYSAEKHIIKLKQVSLAPIRLFLNSSKMSQPIFGNDPRSLDRQKIFTASPLLQDGKQLGYVYVILGSQIYDQISNLLIESKLIRWIFLSLLLGMAFVFMATLWTTRILTRPLNRLTDQVKTIQDKDFAREDLKDKNLVAPLESWQMHNPNEIHVLGRSFKQALEKLSEQYEKVVTIDELRQELLSHISHDLRTPLASMLGYLETWELKKDELSEEESSRFIRTAKINAKKISVLIEQLFELAYLDSGNVQVNQEKFALAELIQDVLVKFHIPAREKNIQLNVSPRDASIQVVGDIEKLERVFTNLLENAIRHTDEGGRITVRLNKDARFVAVEVIDTGIGIPEADLPHVFEPHYKAGNSVRENTAHGGLGLAITKKLLSLHQSNIRVNSKINQGTTFAFDLPVSA